MSTGKYIPPHLRNQQDSQTDSPKTTDQGSFKKTGFSPNNHNSNNTKKNSMTHSYSVPSHLNDISDKQVEDLFEKIIENPEFQVYDSAKVSVHGVQLPPIKSFPGCGVRNVLLENIAQLGYKSPTAVQKYSIPYVLKGYDLIVTSQTGSGKTAAFMLPVITKLLLNPNNYGPTVVCLVPTRELAIQIRTETEKFCQKTNLKVVCVYGGESIQNQMVFLRGSIHILIATPGRLIDIVKKGIVQLSQVQYLILDEADRMLDMGFEPQISEVIQDFDMPLVNQRQTLLFSATFPSEVENLSRKFMKKEFSRIEVGLQEAPTLIEQRFQYVPEHFKRQALVDALNYIDGPTLIFVERRVTADKTEEFLQDQELPVVAIHGDRDMKDRLAALRGFLNGKARIMVATDVAARGIDIPNVAHVINFDLPTDLDSYIHRIGRTGRAGNRGIATAFFNESNEPFLSNFLKHIYTTKQNIPEGLQEYAETNYRNNRSKPRGGYSGFNRERSYY